MKYFIFLIFIFGASTGFYSCKNDKPSFKKAKGDKVSAKRFPNANKIRSVGMDSIQKKLNLTNLQRKKIENIESKYNKLHKQLRRGELDDTKDNLVRRKNFELKILLGDSLRVAYQEIRTLRPKMQKRFE